MPNIAEACPPELRALKGWLVWRLEPHEDKTKKPRKMPYYANGRKRVGEQGSDKDRQQLVTLGKALATARALPDAGVGLAMLDWGLVALDFDDVIGTEHEAEVLELVAGTYAELSPSGKGVRAFMRGSMDNMKSRKPYGFEVFNTTGYVTFTGNMLPGLDLTWDGKLAPISKAIRKLAADRKNRTTAKLESSTTPTKGRAASSMGFTLDQVRDALAVLDPGCGYDEWIKAGMAVHHETDGSDEGFSLWHDWSTGGDNYASEDDCAQHWNSFGKRSTGSTVTMRSLLRTAADAGVNIGAPVATADEFDDLSAEVAVQEEGGKSLARLPSFKRDKQGRIEKTLANVVAAVGRPDVVGIHLGWDDFLGEIMTSPDGANWFRIRDVDYVNLRLALERLGLKSDPGRELIRDAVDKICDSNTFDSAQIWLRDVVPAWDGVERIDTFLPTYWSTKDEPYTRAVGAYLWTALAGRIIDPGCKADMAPIFVGKQGCGKTTGVMALAPSIDFFGNIDFSESRADLSRRIRGRLVLELGELSGLHTREAGHIKLFISAVEETWRPLYREAERRYARRCVFFGTTNEAHFLADETGNRRFLPVNVGPVDTNGIMRDRMQLWAEARDRYALVGVEWHEAQRLADAVHPEFEMIDSNAEQIEPWLDRADDVDGATPRSRRVLQLAEIAQECFGLRTTSRAQTRPIAQAMTRLGYRYGPGRAPDGQVKKGYLVGDKGV